MTSSGVVGDYVISAAHIRHSTYQTITCRRLDFLQSFKLEKIMKRMLFIVMVTLVFNGCIAVIESPGPRRFGPRGFGEPGWVRPPTISVCVLGLYPCPR